MNVNRRFLLKGMALSGIAGATAGSWGTALAAASATKLSGPAGEVLALTSEGVAGSAFLYGAIAASGSKLQGQEVERSTDFMLDLERLLSSGQATHIVGLLDDAAATLVVDMARSAGARVQWLGQHNAEAGMTRHHLLNTDVAEPCLQQLSQELQSCGAFSLNEERHSGIASRRLAAAPASSQSSQWATSIGFLLASMGSSTALSAPASPTASMPVSGSFVSFSIKA